jgi:hypothetical protein
MRTHRSSRKQAAGRTTKRPAKRKVTVSPAEHEAQAEAACGKQPRAEKDAGKKLSGLDAAAKVLAEVGGPLNAAEMVQRMLAKGLWKTSGKTPAATIYAAIIREIATKGKDARFRKTARGKFELAR